MATAADVFTAAGLRVFERGWLSSNNVLFNASGDHGPVLVDSGYCSHADQTVALVRSALGERALAGVINTHLHSDHCGGNAALQQAFAVPVTVPVGEYANVRSWDESRLSYRGTGQRCPRFLADSALAPGESLQLGPLSWQALAAPGHDPHSLVLYQAQLRILISADALWFNGFGVVFPELDGESAFAEVQATLGLIAGLDVDWVIPGHGPPFADCEAAIARAWRRLSTFIDDPRKHAAHAAKVLVKFHLLEVHRRTWDALLGWMAQVEVLRSIHRGHFAAQSFEQWSKEIVADLCRSAAARADADAVENC